MFNLCNSFLSVSHYTFTAFWRAENAISDHSSTGLIKSIILYILVLVLEISAKTTSFSMYSKIARVQIHEFHL